MDGSHATPPQRPATRPHGQAPLASRPAGTRAHSTAPHRAAASRTAASAQHGTRRSPGRCRQVVAPVGRRPAGAVSPGCVSPHRRPTGPPRRRRAQSDPDRYDAAPRSPCPQRRHAAAPRAPLGSDEKMTTTAPGVLRRERLATFRPPSPDDGAATPRAHPRPEPVLALPAAVVRLIRALHAHPRVRSICRRDRSETTAGGPAIRRHEAVVAPTGAHRFEKPVVVQSRQRFRGRCGIDEAIATTTMSFASSTSLGRVETTRNHRAKASIGVIYRRAQ